MLTSDPPPAPDVLPLLHPALRRLLLTGFPALLVASVVVTTIWGEHGLLRRLDLERELHDANDRLARIERDNQRLLRELATMHADPVVMERVAADEIQYAKPGTVLFRFDDPADQRGVRVTSIR